MKEHFIAPPTAVEHVHIQDKKKQGDSTSQSTAHITRASSSSDYHIVSMKTHHRSINYAIPKPWNSISTAIRQSTFQHLPIFSLYRNPVVFWNDEIINKLILIILVYDRDWRRSDIGCLFGHPTHAIHFYRVSFSCYLLAATFNSVCCMLLICNMY